MLPKSTTYYARNGAKVRAAVKAYRDANPEVMRARKAAYHVANKERLNAKAKAYGAAHKEERDAYAREYYIRNGDHIRIRVDAYRIANLEKIAAAKATPVARAQVARRKRANYYADVDKSRADARARYAANPEPYKANAHKRKARLRGVDVREMVHLKVLYERDGGRCRICEKPCEYGVASVDHIVPIAHGGDHSYQNTQLAHLFCNISRGAGRRPAQARLMG